MGFHHNPHAKAYLAFRREMAAFFRDNPDGRIWPRFHVHGWNLAEWRAENGLALDRRISGMTAAPETKADGSDYQRALIQDQHDLRNIRRRIRVYQFRTRTVRERFGHLLSRYDD